MGSIIMKNPPDVFAILLFAAQSGLCFGLAAAMLLTSQDWGENNLLFSIGVIILILIGVTIISIVVVSELLLRPYEVGIGGEISLRFRLKKTTVVNKFDAIEILYLNPKSTSSIRYRYTGGMVKFRGDRAGLELTYEIALNIRKKYFETYGLNPPVPDWTIKKDRSIQ